MACPLLKLKHSILLVKYVQQLFCDKYSITLLSFNSNSWCASIITKATPIGHINW